MIDSLNPIKWDGCLRLLDQRVIPHQEVWHKIDSLEKTFTAIETMIVRGAPCIGFTAIFGMALWAKEQNEILYEELIKAGEFLNKARPTAVNLKFEIDNCLKIWRKHKSKNAHELFENLVDYGKESLEQSYLKNKKMAILAEQELKYV